MVNNYFTRKLNDSLIEKELEPPNEKEIDIIINILEAKKIQREFEDIKEEVEV